MPRRLRLHVNGGIYHVTLRGNHRQPIFFADCDRALLNLIVARALEKYAARLHAYCWMSNHLHLVMQVGTEPLARPMHDIAAEFARAMQLKLATSGHFFERRYHAALVDADAYLLELLRYVHRNPVAAGIADSADGYRWSSHRNYLGARHDDWVTTDFALGMFSADRGRAIAAYRSFVGAAPAQPWEPATVMASGVAVLGDDDFIARALRAGERAVSAQTLASLIAEACLRFSIPPDKLRAPIRDTGAAKVRAWIAHQAGKRGVATVAAVARELGRTEGALRYAMRAYPEVLDCDVAG